MKKLIILIVPAIVLILASCDKVKQPYKPVITLDTTLFAGGVWKDYPWPTFETSTNTLRNVLIEDYTGHICPNCPDAATAAKEIEDGNIGRAFVVSIHEGIFTGAGSFQAVQSDCGNLTENPDSKYCHDFRTPEGIAISKVFSTGFGFTGNPNGTINRVIGDFNMFTFYTVWNQIATSVLSTGLDVNLQAKSNYYESTKGAFLHVEAAFINDVDKSISMVTYVAENDIVTWQLNGSVDVPDYHHHNVFLGCIDGLAFGQNIGKSFKAGDKISKDYSYKLPEGKTTDMIHFLTYVYDEDSYEILQVIKHTL